MDLVHDDGVAPGDEVVLEPPAGDAGGDDHHVPARRLRGRLALAVDDAVPQGLAQHRLGDGTDAERLSRAGPRDDAETLPDAGQGPDLLAVLPLEQRLEPQAQRQLDRLAGGAGRRDDDDPALGMWCVLVGVGIRGEMMVAGRMHGRKVVASDRAARSAVRNENPGGCRDFQAWNAAWIWEIGRRGGAMDRLVVPVVVIGAGDRRRSRGSSGRLAPTRRWSGRLADAPPTVVVAAVPIVERDAAVAVAGPVLGRPVAVDSLDDDDPRPLDHDDPARRRPPVGGVPVADDDVTGNRPAADHHAGLRFAERGAERRWSTDRRSTTRLRLRLIWPSSWERDDSGSLEMRRPCQSTNSLRGLASAKLARTDGVLCGRRAGCTGPRRRRALQHLARRPSRR